VWSDPPQESPGEAAAAWSARGCEHRPEATGVIVLATTAGAACSVQVPDVWAINVTNHGQRFLAIALVAMLGLGLLRVLTLLANYGRRLTASYSGAENALGGWLRRRTEHWRLGRAMWFVWGVALAFHLLYALTVPLAYTNDSVDYYSLGRAFAQAPWFASVDTTVRTPGYPVFIASVLAIFGDTALWIVIVQHLALSLLAPLAVWALARYLPLPAAALAGLLAGIAPALATTANILWTESLYAALTTAALLVYARSGDRLRGLLVAGMLVGAATMVRPTGLLVLLVLLGWRNAAALRTGRMCCPAGRVCRHCRVVVPAPGARRRHDRPVEGPRELYRLGGSSLPTAHRRHACDQPPRAGDMGRAAGMAVRSFYTDHHLSAATKR
jgi:hypothetical protein